MRSGRKPLRFVFVSVRIDLQFYTSSCTTSMVSSNRARKRSVALAACHARALVLLEQPLDESRVPYQGSREWRLRGGFEGDNRRGKVKGLRKEGTRVRSSELAERGAEARACGRKWSRSSSQIWVLFVITASTPDSSINNGALLSSHGMPCQTNYHTYQLAA